MEFGPEVHGRGPRQESLDFSENNLALSVYKQRLPGLGAGGVVGGFFFFRVTLRYRCGRLTPPQVSPLTSHSSVTLVDGLFFFFRGFDKPIKEVQAEVRSRKTEGVPGVKHRLLLARLAAGGSIDPDGVFSHLKKIEH